MKDIIHDNSIVVKNICKLINLTTNMVEKLHGDSYEKRDANNN